MTQAIDSSEDELERETLRDHGISSKAAYLDYLKGMIRDNYLSHREQGIRPSDALPISLGIGLHNYADRVFNNGQLREKYKEHKMKLLSHSPEVREQFLSEARLALSKHPDIFSISSEEIAQLPEKQTERLFNAAFNEKIGIPEDILKEGRSASDLKQAFSDAAKAGDMQIGFLNKGQMLSLGLPDNPTMWPVSAEIARRAARNLSKSAQMLERDISQTTSVEGPRHLPNAVIPQTARKSGNISTEQMVGAGNYADELEYLKTNAAHIKQFVQSGTFDEGLDKKAKSELMERTTLMFALEVERSKTALFTSPMFIDRLESKSPIASAEEYPMAPEGAVSAARRIHDQYDASLPNSRTLDSTPLGKVPKAQQMLISEGELLTNWMSLKGHDDLVRMEENLRFVGDEIEEAVEKGAALPLYRYKNFISKFKEFKDNNQDLFEAGEMGMVDKAFEGSRDIPDRSRQKVTGSKYEDDFVRLQHICTKAGLKEVVEERTLNQLDKSIESSIAAIDKEILEGYYQIDAKALFQGKDLRRGSEQEKATHVGMEIPRQESMQEAPAHSAEAVLITEDSEREAAEGLVQLSQGLSKAEADTVKSFVDKVRAEARREPSTPRSPTSSRRSSDRSRSSSPDLPTQ